MVPVTAESYTWTVPDDISSNCMVIRVTTDTSYTYEGDWFFSIVP